MRTEPTSPDGADTVNRRGYTPASPVFPTHFKPTHQQRLRDNAFAMGQFAHLGLVGLLSRVTWNYDVTVTMRPGFILPECPVCGFRGRYQAYRDSAGAREYRDPTFRVDLKTSRLRCGNPSCGYLLSERWVRREDGMSYCPKCDRCQNNLYIDMAKRPVFDVSPFDCAGIKRCIYEGCDFELPAAKEVSPATAGGRWRRAIASARLNKVDHPRLIWVRCWERGSATGRLHAHFLLAAPSGKVDGLRTAFIRKCGFVSWRALSPLAEKQRRVVEQYAVKHAVKGSGDSRVPGFLAGIQFSPSFPRLDGGRDNRFVGFNSRKRKTRSSSGRHR